MEKLELTIEYPESAKDPKLRKMATGDELQVRCKVAGAPQMVLRWWLRYEVDHGGTARQCGTREATVKDHVVFAFTFLLLLWIWSFEGFARLRLSIFSISIPLQVLSFKSSTIQLLDFFALSRSTIEVKIEPTRRMFSTSAKQWI